MRKSFVILAALSAFGGLGALQAQTSIFDRIKTVIEKKTGNPKTAQQEKKAPQGSTEASPNDIRQRLTGEWNSNLEQCSKNQMQSDTSIFFKYEEYSGEGNWYWSGYEWGCAVPDDKVTELGFDGTLECGAEGEDLYLDLIVELSDDPNKLTYYDNTYGEDQWTMYRCPAGQFEY